jgi:hypothetical protein
MGIYGLLSQILRRLNGYKIEGITDRLPLTETTPVSLSLARQALSLKRRDEIDRTSRQQNDSRG